MVFLRAFVGHMSQAVSRLKCWHCQLDRTVSHVTKDRKWNRAQLEKHIEGRVHARREELIRAFHKFKAAGCTGSALCPSCPKSYKTVAKWLTHLEHHHREELWLREDEEDKEEKSV